MNKSKFIISSIALISIASSAFAHQPVMDMAPRWSDGYGFQIRHENYGSDKLLNGDSKIDNPNNLKKTIHKTWLEGVYTFDRSKRITFKIPYVHQWRTTMNGSTKVKQTNSGIGDLTIAVPLKSYTNGKGKTYNWGITPQLRLPTGSSDGDFPIGDGSTDLGLSFSYSSEQSTGLYELYDLFYWINTSGARSMNEGNLLGFDFNYGTKFGHNDNTNEGYFFLWDISARHQERGTGLNNSINGGSRVHTGPVFVWYKNSLITRAELKIPAYERLESTGHSRGTEFTLAIGVTF